MKFAFRSVAYHDHPLKSVIKKVKQIGYDAIELNGTTLPWCKPHIKSEMSQSDFNQIKLFLKENELEVSSLSAHFDLINEENRYESIELTKRYIMIAKELGVNIVHGFTGKKKNDLSDEKAWLNLIESLNEIVTFSEKQGIKFAIEPNVGMLMDNRESMRRVKKMVTAGNIYVNLDPGNLLVAGDSVKEFIYEFKDDIIHVHAKDGIGTSSSFKYPPLGEGDVDFKQFIKLLKDVKYDGYLSVEFVANIFGDYKGDIDTACRNSLVFLRELV